jgi:DNA-binding transcriptional ArsR family regulator
VVTNHSPERAWDLLGDRSRREIVSLLADGPRAVVEIANDLPISRPAVSQHLRALKDAGLVHDEVVGTRRMYRLDPIAVAAFKDQLDTFWRRALAGYEDVIRAEATGKTKKSSKKRETP